jgi:DNA-binding response OmpR family regulator
MAIRILLIDDNKDLGASVLELLKPRGYEIEEAADSVQAMTMLSGERYDLILLDITFPEQSGIRVLEFIKKQKITSSVLVITGTATLERTMESTAMNEWDFITRPYHPAYLLKIIDHILSDESRSTHKLHIVKAHEFIKSTPTGDLDMTASKHAFVQIAAAGASMEGYTVMLDLREVRSKLTTSNIYQLAADLVKYGDTFLRRTAVLTRDDNDLSQAEFFETASHNRGFNVKAFTDFETAIHWLSDITRVPNSTIV